MFLIHLSALTEEYTKTEGNIAKPINFLSNYLLLTERKNFPFLQLTIEWLRLNLILQRETQNSVNMAWSL